jgi:hypothetical protein
MGLRPTKADEAAGLIVGPELPLCRRASARRPRSCATAYDSNRIFNGAVTQCSGRGYLTTGGWHPAGDW